MTFQIFKFRVLAIALFMMATVSVNAQEPTQMALQSLNFSMMSPLLKTDDIHPPKSVISVHFFCLTCLMALQI